MKDKSLFGLFIEIVFITLGIYLISINIIIMANSQHFTGSLTDSDFEGNFRMWHDSHQVEWRGFNWFYDSVAKYPGISKTLQMITDISNTFSSGIGKNPSDILGWLKFIGCILVLPVWLLVTIIIDILNNVFWFIHFINADF